MKSESTFRSFNGAVYVRIPPIYAEHFKLKQHIERSKQDGTNPNCKIEDKSDNKLIVTFPKWW